MAKGVRSYDERLFNGPSLPYPVRRGNRLVADRVAGPLTATTNVTIRLNRG